MALVLRYVVLLLATSIGLECAEELKKYQIYTAGDKSKWIPVSQLEQIFSSIEESLREINEKQKRDNSAISQLSSNVLSINIRLQGIEDQLTRIERAESYSKVQLQQFSEGSIKEEVQIDQIYHRLEKNQLQLNQRLNDVDSNLETIRKIQDAMEKEIRKINVAQNTLTDNVDELSQHTKQQSTKILQNITNAQQELHQKLKESIKNSPAREEKIHILTAVDLRNSSSNHSKFGQNDDTRSEWSTSMFNVENKLNEIKNQIRSMESNLLECAEVTHKIYNKLDNKRDGFELYMKEQFGSILDQMKQQSGRDLNELEVKLRRNFEYILDEQVSFKNECHRLQIKETQMEDKAVEILEKLFNYVDNRTYEIQHDIENLAICAAKSAANHTTPNSDGKMLDKLEEKLKVGLNNVNVTQNDATSPSPAALSINKTNVMNKLDGTNVQVLRIQDQQGKKTALPMRHPKDERENFYLADEPQRELSFMTDKTKSQNVVPEQNQIPENFIGIEALSRKKRSLTPLS